jgi:hypothetical protein
MDPGPDIEHHHHHHAGVRWLDMIMAGSAILISLISLFVAVQHGKTMEQMVKATTWPNIELAQSNVTPDGTPVVSFVVINTGVGPARIEDFEVAYKGKPVSSGLELLKACCSPPAPPHFVNSTVPNRVLPAKETIDFFVVRKADMTEDQWTRLNAARGDITSTICYCSVLDECWSSSSEAHHPTPVKACPTPKAPYNN